MIKRSPQEIADFFGCEVQVHPYTNSVNLWDPNGDIKEGLGYLNHKLIHMSNTADDKLTYEPQENQEKSDSDKEDSSCYQDFADYDNNAPHQSEVHTHKDYIILWADNRMKLAMDVVDNMTDGWEPLGGVAVDQAFFYQAMVRGV